MTENIDAQILPVIIFLISVFSLAIIQWILKHWIVKIIKRTKAEWDDVVLKFFVSFGWGFKIALGLYLSFQFLHITTPWMKYFEAFIIIILVKNTITSLVDLIRFFIKNQIPTTKGLEESTQNLLIKISSFLLWSIAFVFVLQNLGVNVSALLGGLGVAGVAIAFALQSILEDIFAYFTIQADRPFKEGDFIVSGTEQGTIKNIGLKSTRLNTLEGDELIINNRTLISANIHNFRRMKERRITFRIGVSYDTKPDQLEWIKKYITELIDSVDMAKSDRVHFSEFGDSALMIDITYYISDNDYALKMDIQEKINLSILKEFEMKEIEIAYPTQTIYVKK